jgi:phosphate-selective porin
MLTLAANSDHVSAQESLAAAATPAQAEPLAGIANGTFFARSPDDSIQLFPNGRLQLDGLWLARDAANKMPDDALLVRRARLELAGRIGKIIGFSLGSDFATTSVGTDNFIVVDPWQRLFALQVGQFNAPFTLDNSIGDKSTDFIERSATARTFAVPTTKEVGAMLNGVAPHGLGHWALGLFNGDGQNARNSDSEFDVIGRFAVAPLALAPWSAVRNVTLGGSLWLGNRANNKDAFAAQTTQNGFKFFESAWKATDATAVAHSYELRQKGELRAYAVELNAPIDHRYGVRAEWVHKRQGLAETDLADSKAAGLSELSGTSMYATAWWWAVGDDTLVPQDSTQKLPSFEGLQPTVLRHGLQLLARVERLDETLSSDHASLANAMAGRTQLDAVQVGINYWYSKRFRASINYGAYHLSGTSKTIANAKTTNGGGAWENEATLRLAIAL